MRRARAEIPVDAVDDPFAVEPEAGGGYLVRGVARVLAGPYRPDAGTAGPAGPEEGRRRVRSRP